MKIGWKTFNSFWRKMQKGLSHFKINLIPILFFSTKEKLMNKYTANLAENQIFKKEIINFIDKYEIKLSDELINFFKANPEELFNFEEKIEPYTLGKYNNSLKNGYNTHHMIVTSYERKALKAIETNEVAVLESPPKLPQFNEIPVTDVTNIENENFQLDILTFEYPLFALKLKKEAETFKFKNNNCEIVINSTQAGRATIQDCDIWIYIIAKLMQTKYESKTISRRIRFTAYDFFKKTSRTNSGANLKLLMDSVYRLMQTSITTTEKIGGVNKIKGTHFIEYFDAIKNDKDMTIGFEIVLPEWIYEQVLNDQVLPINFKYFKLTPFEKALYQIARKHCGTQAKFKILLQNLREKIGSNSSIKEFRRTVKILSFKNKLPEYNIEYNPEKDLVIFIHSNKNVSIENGDKKQKALSYKQRKLKKEHINLTEQEKLAIKVEMEDLGYFPGIPRKEFLTSEDIDFYIKNYGAKAFIAGLKTLKKSFNDKIVNPKQYFLTILKDFKK